MDPSGKNGGEEKLSQSASQANAFYREVNITNEVWTLKDLNGFPAPLNSEGKRVMPFWSSEKRVLKIIKTVVAYKEFSPVKIPLDIFFQKWLVGLKKDNFLAGVNWTGNRAIGYDIDPEALKANIEANNK